MEELQQRLIADSVKTILVALGQEPERDDLQRTPERVAKALGELTSGYAQDPALILSTTFESRDYDEMIIVKDIAFTSLCEHHLLVFEGTATIAYIPSQQRIVGLSKFARLVECFARRLQVQERLTTQIARAIQQHLQPQGVGVLLKASHSCMAIRGIRKSGLTVTNCLLGAMRDDDKTRAEFMALVNH
ncbi:MAG: GTP cyclohydrolase I FolE [Acidobacteria bacterium]|nr:GTP cyclohydrolase I FolE [Acidobacteriota bacterium]